MRRDGVCAAGVWIVSNATAPRARWKSRVIRELAEYGTNAIYFALVFAAFTWYRRLILAEYHITYLHYGLNVVEALILAKIVMIGNVLGLGRRLRDKSLIVPTLYQSFVFSLWVVFFGVLEYTLVGWLHGQGWTGGVRELAGQGADELLGRALIMFFAFIPFFAFREMERVLGEGTIWALFFRRRDPAAARPPGAPTPPARSAGKK
jgi:hypothetical protein